jgi:hypothetical protein
MKIIQAIPDTAPLSQALSGLHSYAEKMQKPRASTMNIVSITTSVLICCSLGISLSGCTAESTEGTMTPAATGKSSSTKSADKKAIETNSPLPTPSGTLHAKLEFTCENLQKQLSLLSFTRDQAFSPDPTIPEGRAISSGGTSCRWQNPSGSQWLTASVEKISPEDYRDFAESLGGFNSAATYGSTNDSLEFYSFDGTVASAKILNTTYLITLKSNYETLQNNIGNLAHETEILLLENK